MHFEDQQLWKVPDDLFYCDESTTPAAKKRKIQYIKEKSATPGDGEHDVEHILDELRPSSVTATISTQACSDPATMRIGAVMSHGTLNICSDTEMVKQWHPKYFSMILPFTIPYMVSGPDFAFYHKDLRWRRKSFGNHMEAPWVAPWHFVAGFARRCESQCRQSWNALPIMRSTIHKFAVEAAGMMCSAPFKGKLGDLTNMKAKDWIQMARQLSETLWKGFQRVGNLRLPIRGDTTRLAHAEGLSPKAKALARQIGYKAQHFAGGQQVRQLMGHQHWGARVNYGDCLFFIISPNENHSAWVLRLSRYRTQDPFIQHADATWKRLCGVSCHWFPQPHNICSLAWQC